MVQKHGGPTCDSGELPKLTEEEVDEEGCQWAAAAEQPDDVSNKEETDSDSAMAAAAEQPDDVIGKEETDSADSETSEEAEYTERHGSPVSTVLLGAPPPPSPPYTASPATRLGAISPPPILMEEVWSPIAKTHDKDQE